MNVAQSATFIALRNIVVGLAVMLYCIETTALQPLPAPTEDRLLVISGRIAVGNAGGRAEFDRPMLEALPQAKVTTKTPWTDGVVTFEGPLLGDVLDRVGAGGESFEAFGLNEYSVVIPTADARRYPVLVALKQNGEYMPVRNRGPLWLIYPWSNFVELNAEVYYGRSVWQLVSITVY